MDYLDVLMPCAPDRNIPTEVLNSFIMQDIPCRLFFSNLVGNNDYAAARNCVRDMWRLNSNKSSLVFMADNDVVIPSEALQAMIKFLDQNPDFGAIGLEKNEAPLIPDTEATEPTHVNGGTTLWRSNLLQKIPYHFNDGCECQGACNDLRALGYRIGFLGSWFGKNIEDTRREDLKKNNIIPDEPDQKVIDLEADDIQDQFRNITTQEIIEVLSTQFADLVNEYKKIRALL